MGTTSSQGLDAVQQQETPTAHVLIELAPWLVLLVLIASITILTIRHDMRSADVTTLFGTIVGALFTGAGVHVAARQSARVRRSDLQAITSEAQRSHHDDTEAHAS